MRAGGEQCHPNESSVLLLSVLFVFFVVIEGGGDW
jgi:hypothetical protein